MPDHLDAVMAPPAERLYEKDFYAWTRAQAAALRRMADERWNGPLDLVHLAEEVKRPPVLPRRNQ